ncbi:MAG: hypothetical protein FJ276_11565, partial [Planctomycetes bacterium]|nr:hypothetical protein [Planctomycetota bacterium]
MTTDRGRDIIMLRQTAAVLMLCAVCSASLLRGSDPPDDYALPPAPGPHVSSATHTDSLSPGQPLVLTSYFYWYDDETKSHIINHDGSDALTTHPPTLDGVSYRNPAWHQTQLEDMVLAGVDVALPVYWGTPGSPESWSDVGLPPMVEACERIARAGGKAPKIGMFYDTSTLRYNPRDYHVDLRTAAGQRWFYGTIRNFFSLVPPRHRACIDGRPIVFLYTRAFAADVDEQLIPKVREMFRADFGTDLYLVKMADWPGEADSVYMWGGALNPQYLQVAGIGPGYDHSAVPGRTPLVRDREGGLFYIRAWERLLAEPVTKRPWMVHVETWNEWHEGTDVCESREYGRTYIDLTRQFADHFHADRQIEPQHLPKVPDVVTGAPGDERGVRVVAKPDGDGPVEETTVAGTKAWKTLPNPHSPNLRYLYFDVADGFLGLGDKPVQVTIRYLDQGPARFAFEYDSADPALSGILQQFRAGHVQPLRGTGTWQEASFVVPHALFAGRANGADCRLACTEAELIVASVSMKRVAEHWFDRCLVGMEVGPTGAQFGYSEPNDVEYARRFNGCDIVRKCVEARAQYVVIWARDGDWAYYDSQLARKCPGLGQRDVLRETVREARVHRLPVIAYCVVQQGGHFLHDHPQYQMRDAAGNRIERFCHNSGYLDAMKQLVAEQLAYGIDGFHIDMIDQGFGPPYGCWCEHCRKLFEAEFGRPMPKGVTWDEDWDRMLEFRYATSQRFEQALTAFIRQQNPSATVDYNYHGNPPFSFEVGHRPVQHAGNGDFVTGETGVWGFSALTVGLNAQFYRAAFPGHPYQVAIQRGVRMYHDQTTRPLHDMRWELFTLLSHGAFVTMIDKTAYDGWLDPVAYQRIGEAMGEARAKREHFGHEPVREVGLYFSARTRDWIGRENPADVFQSFQGAHKACVLEHLQFGVVFDENLTPQTLASFPVVCLPHVGILSDRETALLTSYVEQGGKLLVTGHSGQFDRLGQPAENPPFQKLTGARVARRLHSADNWVRFDDAAIGSTPAAAEQADTRSLCNGIPLDWPFLVKGPATVYEPTTATALGTLLAPARTPRQLANKQTTEWPMSAGEAVGPAVLVNRLGKGLVVTLAAAADCATAGEHHIVEARKLFRNAVRLLAPAPTVDVAAPANVEAVVTDDPNTRTLRIHLIAYNPTP